MTEALSLWVLILIIGLSAIPASTFLFSRLPGRGVLFAKPLGLLLVTYPLWLLASLHTVPYGTASAIVVSAALPLVTAAVWFTMRTRRQGETTPTDESPAPTHQSLRERAAALVRTTPGRMWLVGEGGFALCFFGLTLLRSFFPDVWNTEKPMDMAFINAIDRTEAFPPNDPWMSGTPLNYYYYGHYVGNFLIRITGVDPATGYNLVVSAFFALCFVTVFGLASELYSLSRKTSATTSWSPVRVGVIAGVLAMVLGNLASGIQWLGDRGNLANYDWWSPSRVIEGTANEFPFFSFLLGDFHAHMLVTPFTLTFVALALQLAVYGPRWLPQKNRKAQDRVSGWAGEVGEITLGALVLGSLYVFNTLDYATAALIGGGSLFLWATRSASRRQSIWVISWGIMCLLASLALFLPFIVQFRSGARGLSVLSGSNSLARLVIDHFEIYGLLVLALIPLLAHRIRHVERKSLPKPWLVFIVVVTLALAALLELPGFVLLIPLALAGHAVLDTERDQAYRYMWLLVTVGLALVAASGLVYIRDSFEGTADFRFNTVFKLGYQAWFYFSIAAACAVACFGRSLKPFWHRLWVVGLCAATALALIYPLAAPYSRANDPPSYRSLDGLRWLKRDAPDDAAAIEWLRSTVGGTPTILEAVGPDYSARGHARVSTFTGLPAVLGWAGHEVQWRHDPQNRIKDVATIYATSNVELARLLLDRYDVRYVFVGSLERADYSSKGLAKFDYLGRVVYERNRTSIYEIE